MKKTTLTLCAILLAGMLAYGCCPAPEHNGATPAAESAAPVTTDPAPAETAEPTVEPTLETDPYADIIAQYQAAEQVAGTTDAQYGELVALEWQANPVKLFYAISDLDGNGVAELIISGSGDGEYRAYYDIFTVKDGAAARLFDMDFGYRINFTPYADGVIGVEWSNSAAESGCDFYRLVGDTVEVAASFTVTGSDETTLAYTHDGEAVAEEAYNELVAGFEAAGEAVLEWIPVTE